MTSNTMQRETKSGFYVELAENLRRCMDEAGMDVAAMSSATGIPTRRVERILSATADSNTTELLQFIVALGVEPSAVWPSRVA